MESNSEIGSRNFIVISFWVRPEYMFNSTITFYFLNNDVANGVKDEYEAGDCNAIANSFINNFSYSFIINSGSMGNYEVGEWAKIESPPIFIPDEGYDWLIISNETPYPEDPIEINGYNEEGACYIDDVSVVQFLPCSHICAGTDQPINVWCNIKPTFLTRSVDVQINNLEADTYLLD